MSRAEADDLRGTAALIGILLWLAYPFVFIAGDTARYRHRCAGRVYSGEFDDCFNDMLPVELIAFPMTLILLYPFARFAFIAFAPADRKPGGFWRLAGNSVASQAFPFVQVLAAFGMVWAVLYAAVFPLDAAFLPYFGYWAAWLLWFAASAWAAWPISRAGA